VTPLVRRAAIAVACIMSAVYLLVWVPWKMQSTQQREDPAAYAQAVAQLDAGGSMYDPLPPPGPHRQGRHYLYPPVFAAMLTWLPDRSGLGIQHTFVALEGVGLLLFAFGLARIARWRYWPAVPLIMATTIATFGTLSPGEGGLGPLLAGIVVAGLAFSWGLPLLVLAAALKVTPAWAVLVLVARSPRRALPVAVLASALILAAVVATIGPGTLLAESLVWATRVAPTLAQGQYDAGVWAWSDRNLPAAAFLLQGNLSPVFAPLYLLGDPYPHELPGWARTYLTAASTGIPLIVAWRTRRLEPRAQAAVVLAAAVLCAPIFRLGYLPLLAPALVLVAPGRRPLRRGFLHAPGDAHGRSPTPDRPGHPSREPQHQQHHQHDDRDEDHGAGDGFEADGRLGEHDVHYR
jgi:hypothetical protein